MKQNKKLELNKIENKIRRLRQKLVETTNLIEIRSLLEEYVQLNEQKEKLGE